MAKKSVASFIIKIPLSNSHQHPRPFLSFFTWISWTHFVFKSVSDAFVVFDVLLGPVYDADDAKLDGNNTAAQNVDCVSAWKKLQNAF